ncbi:MAG: 2-amino-4-hydroxy-6-hydroxymethyldihydropteridine diphosphokinase [Bacteroidales bacterium]|nr:2-amino-4-hydroxy-6-hydroxymethyldihydropteridine diphosphokinase [Bacteroidales bacterium]
MNELVLSIGSNKGDRLQWLASCIAEIGYKIGAVRQFSPIVESEPWGYDSDSWYLNQVLVLDTDLSANDILRIIHRIESESGRVRTGVYTDRTIDIDILFIGQQIIRQENLIIPHQHLHERLFVLAPLAEIMPDFHHPVLDKSITDLLSDCKDTAEYHWFTDGGS